ncbi:MAG: DNA primase [Phycisphaerales bacterium]|nr:DNA primase [Phycisphaerales bacterium]
MIGTSQTFQMVRNAVRIEDIIGEHIALKPVGKELLGLCPFHDDRRPSMHVAPQKQIYKCFVCSAGGDVFKFVQNYHKMTAGESLRYLAQRAGIKLPELNANPRRQEEATIRQKLLEANAWAMSYFERNLQTSEADPARKYLEERGLTDESIERFHLGFAGEKWTAFSDAAVRAGFSLDVLVNAGLVKKRSDGSPFDIFRSRIIFPIIDRFDKVVAFGGRIVPRDDGAATANADEGPKYLNSAETPVFYKREAMYGLNAARQDIINSKVAVVVEGYMDVIACHQAGAKNVVATLGTSLTVEHARALRYLAPAAVLIFDSDDAGRRAAERALDVFIREPLDVRIAAVPDGKDPCDYCMAHGGAAFKEVVAQGRDALEHQWSILGGRMTAAGSLHERQAAANRLLELVAAALDSGSIDPVRRGLLIARLAGLSGMGREDIVAQLERIRSRPTRGGSAMEGDSDEPEQATAASPYANIAISAARSSAERWALGCLLTDPRLYASVREDMAAGLFMPHGLRDLAHGVIEYLDNAADVTECSMADFLGLLDDQRLVNEALDAQADAEKGERVGDKLLDAVRWLSEHRHEVPQTISEDVAALADPATETVSSGGSGGVPAIDELMLPAARKDTRHILGPRPPRR